MHPQTRQSSRSRVLGLSLAVLAVTVLAACGSKSEQPQSQQGSAATARSALTQPSWQLTGSLNQSGLDHSALLLPSGKVLVAGGYNQMTELYDPATGTWSLVANLLTTHRKHTATLLDTGHVLIAGGKDCQPSSSAEVFNPSTSQWSFTTGALLTCRGYHSALKLPSGKVLVVGGTDTSGVVLSSAELYDPATGSFTATGSMATARADFTATLLPNGKVLVAGGTDSSGALLGSAELYDPATGSFSPTASMGTARAFHTDTSLPGGKVLVVGGGGTASAELYDSTSATWTATGSMSLPRRRHSATLLPSGKVLVAGGYNFATGIQFGAELYDPASGTFSAAPSMHGDRYHQTATLLPDGRVLVAGGYSNTASGTSELYLSGTTTPPEPVPSPIEDTRFTPVSESTTFLYSGTNAIQVGVAAGTIKPQRAAVLRGLVKTREGTTLEGVRITLLNHPEYGHTLTRTDGMFDMAVNGGGALTVQYDKEGYLPAQRQVEVGWASYAWLPDVILIPLDSQVTTVTLNGSATGFQAAQGSVTTDEDGSRQATILFPPDTQASLVLPNGSIQPLSTLHVRATEYTVGDNGPQSMPGELPPASGYTYAVELSVDEAISAGAREVRFSRPVYLYVDNFLDFPVGEAVPSGWYDRQAGVWRPSDDGRILRILSVSAGLAVLDVTGDGVADEGTALSTLGITDSERQRLASLFSVGKSFWRAPIPHFTPWDLNWPYTFPPNAQVPDLKLEKQDDEEDSDLQCGSIIDCQNQVLGESANVVGTPFQLRYRSDRVPAFRTAQIIKIPLSGDTLPASVSAILMQVEVAGQRKLYAFPPSTNLSTSYQWDGKDGYGRPVQGIFPLTIRIGYSYRVLYLGASGGGGGAGGFSRSFARFGMAGITYDRGLREAALWQTLTTTVGTWITPTTQLGGWTLDVHHTYDPTFQTLYFGHGERRAIGLTSSTPVINTAAGNGDFGSGGDGAHAKDARLWNPHDVAFAPDGTLYIADSYNNRIRRVGTDGVISTLPGSEEYQPRGVAVAPDGTVYVAHPYLHCIRKVLPNGTSSTFAGTCGFTSNGASGDGGPATSALLSYPHGLALGKEGNLYIADFDNDRIRYVTPEGIIHTLAGTLQARGYCGDGGPALNACLNGPWSLAVGTDGSVYFSDSSNHRVRRIGTDGRISTVVGTGVDGSLSTSIGDGGPARQAALSVPKGLALDPAGNLYISDYISRIRRVDTNGIIITFAGQPLMNGYNGEGLPSLKGLLDTPLGLAISPDGALYVSDEWNNRIRRIGFPVTFVRENEAWVPSEDGGELYIFTQKEGRHVRTVDAVTQVVLYEFGYDAAGRLTSIKDKEGLITQVERDSTTGKPLALVAPYGQRTQLEVDANGYLSAIINPAAERLELTHSAEGLLTQQKDARGGIHTYEYTSGGRLKKDSNPVGGSKTLTRTALADGYKVTVGTALSRTTTYQVQNFSTGEQKRTTTLPSGEVSSTLRRRDGTTLSTAADGTVTTVENGPDPRLGMQASYVTAQSTQLPSGLTRTQSSNRSVTLLTPGDTLSLATLTDSRSVNGLTSLSTYDAATRTLTTTSPLGKQSTLTLDAKGRLVRSEVPGIFPAQYSYRIDGRLESVTQGTRTSSFTYNPQGYVQTQTDALSRVSSLAYDHAGRLETQTLPSNRTIGYGYDDNGNLTSLTPPGRTAHAFTYTLANQEEDYVPPSLAGVSRVTSTSLYNLDSQPTEIKYPDFTLLTLSYEDDATAKKGRLLTMTLTPPSGGRYASLTRQANYHPGSGYLKTLTDSRGPNLSYLYDGPLTTRVTWTGAVQGNVGYGYDTFFRVSSLSVNGAQPISYGYDNDGLLTQAGGLTLSLAPNNGLPTGTVLDQVSTTLGHNGYGEMEDLTAHYGTTSLFSLHLVRDVAGRIQEKQETVQGVTHVYSYTYDTAGQLKDVKKDGVLVSSAEYDGNAAGNGNRTAFTQGGITRTATYDAQDRLLTYDNTSYTYGPNGDLQTKQVNGQVTTYVYDALGNLLSATLPDGTQLEYIIDAQNRRVGKKVNGVLVQGFLYDGQLRVIAELNGSSQVVSRFVYASQSHVPDYMLKGGVTYRILTDHLGSPRLVVDASTGSIAQRLDYDTWGVVLADTTPGFQPFGFAGGLYDNHTHLVRFGARDYDAETGRWTAKDPIRFRGGDTNLYAYVGNSPLMFTDESGLFASLGGTLFLPPIAWPQRWQSWWITEHYNRNQYNQTIPYDVAIREWTKLPDNMSIYHRHGPGNERNEKFISPSGQCEAVYKDGQLVTDPANLGTYNFGPPHTTVGKIDHFFRDVVPYWLLGNAPDDPTPPWNRVLGP